MQILNGIVQGTLRVLNKLIVKDIKASGTIEGYNINATSGYLKATNNGNTIQIGSQNGSYCHITNTANVPFWFNKGLTVDGNIIPYTTNKTLGASSSKWASVYATTFYGDLNGKLSTARSIFGKSFDGSANIEGKATFYGSYNSDDSKRYVNGALQIRENDQVGSAQSDIKYAPTIGFHWSGRKGGTLALHSDGIFYLRQINGTDRATIDANVIGALTGNADSATSSSKLAGSASTTAVPMATESTGIVKYYYNVNTGLSGNMPTSNNANGILNLNTHGGNYMWQLGFSSNGNLYSRYSNGSAITADTAWKTILDSSNYSDYAASKDHTHSYLPLSGGTLTNNLTAPNFIANGSNGYRYILTGVTGGCARGLSFSINGTELGGIGIYSQITTVNWVYVGGTYNAPWLKVTPAGNLTATGTITGTKVYNAIWNDYAEWFERESLDENFEPGDIVEWSNYGVIKSSQENSEMVVGVYSNTYGHIVGGEQLENMEDNIKKFVPIGVSGRVYVKVLGKVKRGNMIVSSNIPGVGIAIPSKEKLNGTSVGKALEEKDSDGIGLVKIMIMLS